MFKKCKCCNCDKRKIGCHSTCEDYKAYRSRLDTIKEQKRLECQRYAFTRSHILNIVKG